MAKFSTIDAEDWSALVTGMRPALGAASNLEQASGVLTQRLHESFPEATALVRVYAVIPYRDLTHDVRRFVDALVGTSPNARALTPETPVLTLMATRGSKPAWCDRKLSKGHVAIPLVSAAFVQNIPMVARLLKELGVDLAWLDEAPEINARRLLGGFNGVFFVQDATAARDNKGRLIIPAQDFVKEQNIRTVFGMGGFFPGNALVAIIVFCKESVARDQVDQLKALVSVFKGETSGLVLRGKFFAHEP